MKKARLFLAVMLTALAVSGCTQSITVSDCYVDPGGNNRCE